MLYDSSVLTPPPPQGRGIRSFSFVPFRPNRAKIVSSECYFLVDF